ncbi:unnamed protein product [Knipowitschia caucasica]
MRSATGEGEPLCNVQVGHQLGSRGTNGNESPRTMQVSLDNIRKRVRNNSYQDLRGEEPEGPSDKGSCPTFNAARRASEPGKVTMAAVAPFRFRFQVQEEMDASL